MAGLGQRRRHRAASALLLLFAPGLSLRLLRLQHQTREPPGSAVPRRAPTMAGFYLGARPLLHPARRSRCSTWRSASPGCSPLSAGSSRCCRTAATRLYNWVSRRHRTRPRGAAACLRIRLRPLIPRRLGEALRDCDKTVRKACRPTCCGHWNACARRQSTFGRGMRQARMLAVDKNRNKVKDLARVYKLQPTILRPSQTRENDGHVAKSSSPVSGVAERYAGSLFELAAAGQAGRRRSRPISAASRRCSTAAPI